jgi:hypothetical protein
MSEAVEDEEDENARETPGEILERHEGRRYGLPSSQEVHNGLFGLIINILHGRGRNMEKIYSLETRISE